MKRFLFGLTCILLSVHVTANSPTGQVKTIMCVGCHGGPEQISPEVKSKLSELYPNDKALNYQPGQLRGAVVLSRSAP